MTTRRVISLLENLPSSVNGNPRFLVHFTDGSSAVTMSDAMFCYGLTNRENFNTVVEVEFTRAGRIRNITPVGP